jgi:stage V sporulation protein AD
MLIGHRTWAFENRPVISGAAAVVGPEEGNGPLANDYDIIHEDKMLGQDSWEKAEQTLLEEAAKLALERAGIPKERIGFYISGDLLNQITSSSYTARTLSVPYIGVFGACSTSMESLALAAFIVNGGGAEHVLSATSSHNSTAERQFRYPTEYGAQKPPTAQYTVTGAGAAVVSKGEQADRNRPVIASATLGRVVDMGIKDPFNMGAAMAPAAVDTIQAHLKDLNRTPGDYDLIVTGDLAGVGYEIALELFRKHQVPIEETQYYDCGLMVYDRNKQPVQAGGSGCACSAVVTYGHLLKRMARGELRRILVVATGALMSPTTVQQGESIPCIAHAVCIENGGMSE